MGQTVRSLADNGAVVCRRLLPTKHRPTRTRKGLTYTLYEGHRLESLSKGDSKLGDGNPWMPTIRVSGGDAAFYSIDVRK